MFGFHNRLPAIHVTGKSYSGGTVAEYTARTGCDAIVINGASNEPLWIEISEGGPVRRGGAVLSPQVIVSERGV